MRDYEIETPDGKTIVVEGPDDATDDELIAFAQAELKRRRPSERFARPVVENPSVRSAPAPTSGLNLDPGRKAVQDILASQQSSEGTPGFKDVLQNSATLSLQDEINGGVAAIGNVLTSPFTGNLNPSQAYYDQRDADRARLTQARESAPLQSLFADVLGGFVTGGNVARAAAAAPTALAALRTAAREGAALGGVAGWGSGTDAGTSAVGGVLGGAFGGVLGGAAPIVASGAQRLYGGARRLFGSEQPQLARQLVGDALAADGNSGAGAGASMDAANALGVPRMLADTGDNVRALLASVSRQPGPSRTLAREAVIGRQRDQGGRVRVFIERDLGPTTNVMERSDQLQREARAAAAPLYDEAYSAPLTVPEDLAPLMARPSIQKALGNARRIAAEEGRNPTELGFVETPEGIVTLPNAPSMQTYDYLKRGLDDVLEGYRDRVSGRLVLDTEGRAIEGTRQRLVSLLDQSGDAGRAYSAARAAYAGPASARSALAEGSEALRWTDEELARRVNALSDADREQFALGYRSALAKSLEGRVDDADKARAVLGTPAKRAALRTLFGGDEGLARFETTLGLEREANDTFRSIATGSQTAERLAADAQTGDGGLVEAATDAALRGAQGGVMAGIGSLFRAVRDAQRFQVGRAGQEVRQSIASYLTETDPAILAQIIDEANRAAQLVEGRRRNVLNGGVVAGRSLSQGIVTSAGNQ